MIPNVLYCPIRRGDLFHNEYLRHHQMLFDSYELAYNHLNYPIVMTVDAESMISDGVRFIEISEHSWKIESFDEKYIKRECYLDKYDELRVLDDGKKIARYRGVYSYLDADNKELASHFHYIESFIDGWALVKEFHGDTITSLIDKKGNWMTVNGEYISWAEPMSNGRAFVAIEQDNGKLEYYLVDNNAQVLTHPFTYFYRLNEDNNIVIVCNDNSWGLLNVVVGRIIVPCKYSRPYDDKYLHLSNSIVIVSETFFFDEDEPDDEESEERFHFYTLTGETTNDYFDEYEPYNNLYLVRINDLWGCLNNKLEYVVVPSFGDKESVINELKLQE